MQVKRKILIVDDHPVFRAGLAYLINEEPDMAVSGEAETIGQALNQMRISPADLVISDITLKGRSGLELVREFTDKYKYIPVLIVSMHDENIYAERALRAGAKGYITKQEMTDNVIEAIRTVLKGHFYVSRMVTETILSRFNSPETSGVQNKVVALTDRELEVFHLIGEGLNSRQISQKLNVSVKTVGSYKENIKKKLDINSSPELIRYAVIFNFESRTH